VLPFANMSGDQEQEYFSDGISEDIITDLSKVSALAVVSRNTAFTFKGKNVDVSQVARQLKVGYVLEGSVRKAGGRVRISAQLIDGSNDNHIWAERYDRDLSDIFALQDEISEAIVKALKLKLLPEEKKAIEHRGTDNAEAYNLYLMARQHYATGIVSEVRRCDTVVRLCRAAIELDPNYARAWALMATAQRHRLYTAGEGDNGLRAATRALELDANLAEAHAARGGFLLLNGDHRRRPGRNRARTATGSRVGRRQPRGGAVAVPPAPLEDAIRHFEKVSALVETDYASGGLLITCYTALGDMDGVRRVAPRTLGRAEKALAQEADNGSAMAAVFTCLLALGETERAKDMARRAVLIDPDNLIMRYNLACDLVMSLQDLDGALEFLGPVLKKTGRENLEWMKCDPDMDALRSDPRFQAMIDDAEQRLSTAGA
jgi:adenylate cyclase